MMIYPVRCFWGDKLSPAGADSASGFWQNSGESPSGRTENSISGFPYPWEYHWEYPWLIMVINGNQSRVMDE
jgi:hypothetical protein